MAKTELKTEEKLTDLPNISKVLSAVLADAGINTPAELRALGSKEAFLRIRMRDNTACLSKLCAIEGAIRGVRWHNLDADLKEELRVFFKGL
jgi:DNA transformation protein and related proteins